MLRLRVEFYLDDTVHLEVVVVPSGIELGAEIEDQMRVRGRGECGGRVIRLEGSKDLVGIVHEVQHVGPILPGMGAIQARESLHGLEAG